MNLELLNKKPENTFQPMICEVKNHSSDIQRKSRIFFLNIRFDKFSYEEQFTLFWQVGNSLNYKANLMDQGKE